MTNRKAILMTGLIVLITFITYLSALRNGFVFDDGTQILHNQLLKAPDGLSRIWFTTQAPDYYPLTWSLLWCEWHLWGNQPMGYHVVNVLLHAMAAILVWLVLRRLKIPVAWLAAVLFAIHPVNVSAVAWVSEQKSTLAMLFYALSILLYLKSDQEDKWSWMGLSLAAFLLALLSKSAVVMLPFVLMGCIWWRHGEVRWKDLLAGATFLILALVAGLTTIWFQHNRALGGNTVRTDGFLPRLVAAGWAPWFYLYKALWPFNLTVMYPKWEINAGELTSWLPGIALVGCFVMFWWKRQDWGRAPLFGFGYFVVTLFPVLGFFDQGFYHYSLVADHWQYFSIVGVIALAVAAGDELCQRLGELGRMWRRILGVSVVLILAMASWRRSTVYASNETLWRDNVATNPRAWMAYDNLGVTLGEGGKFEDAMNQFREALKIAPNEANVHDNLGVMLTHAGHTQEAITQYELALRIRPDLVDAHNNLGAVLAAQGKIGEATAHYEEALRLNPNHAGTCNNFAWLLATNGKSTAADHERSVQLASRAVQLTDGGEVLYLDTLAAAYAATGRFQDAVATARHAVELARSDRQSKLASEIEARARLYQDGKPYRE